jgi:hypothetical protein
MIFKLVETTPALAARAPGLRNVVADGGDGTALPEVQK